MAQRWISHGDPRRIANCCHLLTETSQTCNDLGILFFFSDENTKTKKKKKTLFRIVGINTKEIRQSTLKNEVETKLTLCFWNCNWCLSLWIWTVLKNRCQIGCFFYSFSEYLLPPTNFFWLVSLHQKIPSPVLLLATWLVLLALECFYQYRKTRYT